MECIEQQLKRPLRLGTMLDAESEEDDSSFSECQCNCRGPMLEFVPEPDAVATEPEAGPLSAVLNLQQALNELINLMVRKKIINENEGAALLRRMFR